MRLLGGGGTLSSKQLLKIDSLFELHMLTIYVPTGSARSSYQFWNCLDRYRGGGGYRVWRKKSIVRITNSDNMCFARAIVVANASQENNPN